MHISYIYKTVKPVQNCIAYTPKFKTKNTPTYI